MGSKGLHVSLWITCSGAPNAYPVSEIPSVAVSVSPFNKLDGITIRISDPSSAQLAVEKVMGRREKRRGAATDLVVVRLTRPTSNAKADTLLSNMIRQPLRYRLWIESSHGGRA
jgi:hypothetical protein